MKTTEKTCFKCGQSKPLSDFYKHKAMADGHLNKCKECTKADVRERRYGESREQVLQYDRDRAKLPHRVKAMADYAKTEAGKAAHARASRKNHALHPGRRAARIALGNAVRDGRVTPLPCFCCGEKAEAHHPDYSDPLYPVWLCPAHHKQAHALKVNS